MGRSFSTNGLRGSDIGLAILRHADGIVHGVYQAQFVCLAAARVAVAGADVYKRQVLSYDVTAEQMKDWACMMDIEFVHITKDTTLEAMEHDLFLSDLAWKLK